METTNLKQPLPGQARCQQGATEVITHASRPPQLDMYTYLNKKTLSLYIFLTHEAHFQKELYIALSSNEENQVKTPPPLTSRKSGLRACW